MPDVKSPLLTLTLALSAVGLIALGDAWTDLRVSLAMLHVLPVALVAWRLGWQPAALVSLAALGASAAVDLHVGLVEIDGAAVFAWLMVNRLFAHVSAVLLLARLRRSHDRLEALARTDALTGLLNRRAFSQRADEELRRAARSRQPVTVAMLDLDDFKVLNDAHGHAAGDEALRLVGRVLADLRSGELCCRLGGDEFALLFPASEERQVRAALARLEALLQSESARRGWRLDCSIGLASTPDGTEPLEALLARADAAMYAHKRAAS